MPKCYSGDLQERVIEAVEMDGVSRREAAERFDVSVSSAVGAALEREPERGDQATRRKRLSVEAHAERILALVAERPDQTLMETVAELLKRRGSNQPECAFAFFWQTRHHLGCRGLQEVSRCNGDCRTAANKEPPTSGDLKTPDTPPKLEIRSRS
jgi:hypothetical protein